METVGGLGATTTSNKGNVRYSTGAQKLGSERRPDAVASLRGEGSPLKGSNPKKGVAKNHSTMNFEYQPVQTSKSKAKQGPGQNPKVEMKSASVANFSLSLVSS